MHSVRLFSCGFALVLMLMISVSCGGGDENNQGNDTTQQQDNGNTDQGPGLDADDTQPDTKPEDVCQGNTQFEVGTGIADITGPAADAGLMGYVVPAQKSAGLHMRQWAKAFIIHSPCNGKRIVIVVMDTQGLFQDIHIDVIAQLKEKYGDVYSEENVILHSTHTHSVPGGAARAEIFQSPPVNGFYQEVLDGLVDGAMDAIGQAHESLKPASLSLAIDSLSGASVNRSPGAFDLNPEELKSLFPNKVDETVTQIRVDLTDGTPLGLINFFGVHTTSVAAVNKLITPDNKGLAAWWFQDEMARKQPDGPRFIAAFANTNAGDISPNVDGFSFEKKDGILDYADMEKSAKKQYDKAVELFEKKGDAVVGGIDYRMQYVKFDEYQIDPSYTDGKEHSTCPPASGLSMLAGGKLDWPVIESMLYATCESKNNEGCTLCQAEKPECIALYGDPPALPPTLPFMVARIGQLGLVVLPFEITTMAGYRIRTAALESLKEIGITHTICFGYSNSYNDYMVTREEYVLQDYEAGFTVFGPWSNMATVQIATELSRAMVSGETVDRGPDPMDLSSIVTPAAHWNDFDAIPADTDFGDVAEGPAAEVSVGETAKATFWAAHLSNDFMLGKTFLTIEKKDGDSWSVVATDDHPSTKLYWKRINCLPANHCSQSRVEWTIPEGTLAGTYRIGYNGYWKNKEGTLTPFEGHSSEFEVK